METDLGIDESDSTLDAGGRDKDIVAMLVNIYGSKELFVTEYPNP